MCLSYIKNKSWLLLLIAAMVMFWHAAWPLPDTRANGGTEVTWLVEVSGLKSQYEAAIAEFERLHPGVTVRPIWVPKAEYQSKFRTLAAAGQPPDVFYAGDVWVAHMLPFLRDLTPWIERDRDEIQPDDFYPSVLNAMQHDGGIYFMPKTMNVSLLYYNRTLFDEAGLAYPTDQWTWDDYIAAAIKISAIERPDGLEVYGIQPVYGWWGEWLIYLRQSGGQLFSDDGMRCLMDSEAAVAGISFYHDKVYRWEVSPRQGYGPSTGFASNRVGMLYGGHTGEWKIYGQVPELNWDIQVLPIGPAGREGGEIAMAGYGVSKDSDAPELAWELVKHLTSAEAIAKEVAAGNLAVRRSVAETMLLSELYDGQPRNIDAVYQQLPYSQPIPRNANYIEIALQIIQPEIDLMMQGRASPEQACVRAAAAANHYLQVMGER
jgi:multiple sugar transport system substrate-binding protein